MQLVASCYKYRGNRDKLVGHLTKLVKKVPVRELEQILETVKENQYVMWTEGASIRITR